MNMKIKWSTTLWISSPNTNEQRLHYHSLKSWPFVFSWWRLLLHQFKPRCNINSTLMSRKNGISAKSKSMLIKIFTGSLSFEVIFKLIHFLALIKSSHVFIMQYIYTWSHRANDFYSSGDYFCFNSWISKPRILH